jgi:glycosyltransferase involved in cell wall biosynthesis
MKVALVHDWLNQVGGAEDVLESLVSIFPDAPVYTSIYWRDKMPAHWQNWDIRTSFLDGLPRIYRRQQLYLPLFPLAFEQFDFSDYDLVLSNKSGFAHGIITSPQTLHICYCLTPTRYLWRYHQYAAQEKLGRGARVILAPFLSYLRLWDRLAADRVDQFIAISREIRRRIAKFYRRDSTIIYPPVDLARFDVCGEPGDYYLFVGRLLPYRRLDVMIEAFNRLGRPLLIAGSGRDRQRLESLANPNVTFLGYVDDGDLPDLMARSRAFVWPGEEDFGIAPIQAMAAGRPVIAYAAGGALDTVIPGTGALFAAQTPEAIINTVEAFDGAAKDPAFIRAHAAQFDSAVFRQRILTFIDKAMEAHRAH